MPCMKCPNGKWKYGEHGNCQFNSKKHCRKAEIAIIIKKKLKEAKDEFFKQKK